MAKEKFLHILNKFLGMSHSFWNEISKIIFIFRDTLPKVVLKLNSQNLLDIGRNTRISSVATSKCTRLTIKSV